MLDRDAAVRAGMAHGGDDAGLLVAPFDRPDPGGAAQRRILAVGGDDQPAGESFAVGQGDRRPGRRRLHRRDRARGDEAQARQGAGAAEQDPAQYSVLDDIAERRVAASRWAQLAMVVMHEQRRRIVGDADLADRLGLGRDLRPQPDAVEDQARAVGDRRGAPVECLRQHRHRVVAVDHGDRQPGIGTGDGEQHPVEPAADDHQFDIVWHRDRMGRAVRRVQRRSVPRFHRRQRSGNLGTDCRRPGLV
jgi:hypothetical protein